MCLDVGEPCVTIAACGVWIALAMGEDPVQLASGDVNKLVEARAERGVDVEHEEQTRRGCAIVEGQEAPKMHARELGKWKDRAARRPRQRSKLALEPIGLAGSDAGADRHGQLVRHFPY